MLTMKTRNRIGSYILVLVGAVLVGNLMGCKPDEPSNGNFPQVPDPRPPTLDELIGQGYEMFWQFDPQFGSPADAWRGTTKITLQGPSAGHEGLRAELEFLTGFEGAEACLENGRATWVYDDPPRIEFHYETDDMTEIVMTGQIERRFYTEPNGPVGSRPTQQPSIVYRDNAAGGWAVTKGDACEEDDFSPGNNGQWTIGEGLLILPAENKPVVRKALYVFDQDGLVGTVTETVSLVTK